jgi:hypothetical protein
MDKKQYALGLFLVILWTSVAAQAGDKIFSDSFESGDVSAWPVAVGYVAPAETMRWGDLELRDPHVFVDLSLLGCFDFTDTELPLGLGPSFNDSVAATFTGDDNEDGFLDSSLLSLFRPLDENAQGERVDLEEGDCTAPVETTTCTASPDAEPTVLSYEVLNSGLCLSTVVGTTSGYTPSIHEPAAPCFVTSIADLTFNLGGLDIVLEAAQFSAVFVSSPPDSLAQGLLLGFLPEAVADTILLPADLPVVGGEPLSLLLPGGTGNCAPGDDRDVHNDESGWWIYWNYTAELVAFSE